MPRTHGYSLIGNKCIGVQDWHAKGRLNAIGAILNMLFITVSIFEGSVNSDVFYSWLTQDLLPKVSENSVIVMDNASFHKRSDMIEAIQDKGIILEFLPPYSPDLNPIEHKWAQAKSIRRKYRCDVNEIFSKHSEHVYLY